jgi:hypothetical protein
MISEQTKKDFVGAYSFAEQNDLKLLMCVYCDKLGGVHLIATEQLTKPQMQEVLTDALANVEVSRMEKITT